MLPDSPPRRRNVARNGFLPLNAYSVRLMLGLAASLGVLVLCVRLPLHAPPARVGWGPSLTGPLLTVKDIREAAGGTPQRDRPGAPITSFGATNASVADTGDGGGRPAPKAGAGAAEAHAAGAREAQPVRRPGVAQLHTLDRKPQAIGGIGGVYVKIDYPEAARRDSIEGRLFLHFIVEKDGSTSHVQVVRSLHPLCDSAAVRAVERTRFMPGQRDGQTVRVAMSLPVRFKLADEPLQASRAPAHSTNR